jgi:hypothetical protein
MLTREMSDSAKKIPWPSIAALVSCTSMLVGWHWDISWHRSIGRDTPFTLPHLAIYAALIIAFGYNAWLVLSHTFGAARERPAIKVLGFRAPSACFLTLWAILVMFAGILFDTWWHDSYGLDVGVFSPPHYVLSFSLAFIYLGQFAYVILARNLDGSKAGFYIAVAIWGLYFGHQLILDPSYGTNAVLTKAYLVSSAIVLPVSFVLVQRVLEWRWAPLASAAVYTVVVIVLMQVFQLFPAEPAMGPVYHRLPNFLPPLFPLFLVVPACLMGEVAWRYRTGSRVKASLILGPLFVISFAGSNFAWAWLVDGSLGQNRFIGGMYPGVVFYEGLLEVTRMTGTSLEWSLGLLACILAMGSCWAGFVAGDWFKRLQR